MITKDGGYMKTVLKILGGVFAGVVAISLVLSIVTGYITYPFSLSEKSFDKEYKIMDNVSEITNVFYSGERYETDWFNYYGVKYSTEYYFKGYITYFNGIKELTEEFFLEPAENGEFYSYIDGFLEGKKANALCDVRFECLNNDDGDLVLFGVSTFNRDIPENEIFIESENHKLGIDLHWGGALSYLEALNDNVEAVMVDERIKVDSNASQRYNAEAINKNVNLINRNDTGRLVQQSYYGTLEYETATYMDNEWRYNPVQGGNQYNDASKIVDLRITDDSVYVKCRPLDWAKEKEYITPSYMEATYSLEGDLVHASCRFVDFSGYPSATATQEIPAFYCIEPFNRYVYYAGDKPWSDEPLTVEPDLIFWPDAGYPNFVSREHWSAFTGEFEDSYGIGVYVPEETTFLSGVCARGETTQADPSVDGPTSYIAVVKEHEFNSFEPFSYEFYLATGTAEEMRADFKALEQ